MKGVLGEMKAEGALSEPEFNLFHDLLSGGKLTATGEVLYILAQGTVSKRGLIETGKREWDEIE